LPDSYRTGHELCFTVHDFITGLLVTGQQAAAFNVPITLHDEADRLALEKAEDIFVWLEQTRRTDERNAVLVTAVFPAVLSDMVHCFYEALETSRKGKLGITYMLLRKPLQESLFLFESIIVDRHDFGEKLTLEPSKLWSQGAGGLEPHTKRIRKVLDVIGQNDFFDPAYLAQLRYDKDAEDGFDGICNKAMHLFTTHKAIRTEPLNINFIFSNIKSMETQWAYLYSRLPYLLIYIYRVVEYICSTIVDINSAYFEDMDRRMSALVLLWWDAIENNDQEPHLKAFVQNTQSWLNEHCNAAGYNAPTHADLIRIVETGAYPNEPKYKRLARKLRFESEAEDLGVFHMSMHRKILNWAFDFFE